MGTQIQKIIRYGSSQVTAQTYYIFDELAPNEKAKSDVLYIDENFKIEEIQRHESLKRA